MLSKINLKKLQRALIGSFKNYNLSNKKPFRAEKLIAKVNPNKKYELDFRNFDPETDLID